jgi:hypothetical protein
MRITRCLPKRVLRDELYCRVQLESQDVEKKFSNPTAKICEDNVDYVALLYLNSEATLFWLPKFFSYIRCAKLDSYHFHCILMRLSDPKFVAELASLATPEEYDEVHRFLTWLPTVPGFLEGVEPRIMRFELAKRLWKLT